MPKSKHRKNRNKFVPAPRKIMTTVTPQAGKKITILAWGATPHVITGFGIVMRELLQGLFHQYPGTYDVAQVAINYGGDFCDEFAITGGPQNGRHMQWTAAVPVQGGGTNLYGQPKFIEFIRNYKGDFDAIFLFEDPFWVGGNIPGLREQVGFVDAIRGELVKKGVPWVPIVAYFPIDGIPKPSWIRNISKVDIPVTYLNFGKEECLKLVPELAGRLSVINHGVNTKEFFPINREEARVFKRAMFGDRNADKFMLLNVNRNQVRKLVPSTMMAFAEFKKQVPNSFLYLNMRAVDVGWNLIECCNSLGLRVGEDVMFPPDFNVQKGLSIEDLNRVFNAADVLVTTAVGGGWELSVSQAFATRTTVLAPANTSHVELCGDQEDLTTQRGILYRSGSNLSQWAIFPSDNEVRRPLPDLEHMVEKLLWIHSNQETCRAIEENAYQWATTELSWEKRIVPQFHNVFTSAKRIKELKKQQHLQQQAQPQQAAAPAPIGPRGAVEGTIKIEG